MKALIITIAFTVSLAVAYRQGLAHGSSRESVNSKEYKACVATIQRAGARNTELRHELESKK